MRTTQSRPAGRFFYLLVAILIAATGLRAADTPPTTTLISDTVYRANGTPAAGTLVISWPAFETAEHKTVAAGLLSVKLGPSGSLNVPLVPNMGATPLGTFYKVVTKLDDGTTTTEYWNVPNISPATVASVRTVLQIAPPQAPAQNFVQEAEVSSAPLPNKIPRAGADGKLAEAWIPNTVAGPLAHDPVSDVLSCPTCELTSRRDVNGGYVGRDAQGGVSVPGWYVTGRDGGFYWDGGDGTFVGIGLDEAFWAQQENARVMVLSKSMADSAGIGLSHIGSSTWLLRTDTGNGAILRFGIANDSNTIVSEQMRFHAGVFFGKTLAYIPMGYPAETTPESAFRLLGGASGASSFEAYRSVDDPILLTNFERIRIANGISAGVPAGVHGILSEAQGSGTVLPIAVLIGGAEIARFASGGVGIGTAPEAWYGLDVASYNARVSSAGAYGTNFEIRNTDTGGVAWRMLSTGHLNDGGAGQLVFAPGSGSYVLRISSGGYVGISAPIVAPPDNFLATNNAVLYLDEASNRLKVRVKYSNGTLKTATLTLN